MTALWLLAALAPLLTALALTVVGLGPDRASRAGRSALTRWAPLAVLPAIALGILAPSGSDAQVSWLLLGSTFELDTLARPLVIMSGVLYALALVLVARKGTERADALSGLLLLCFVGNVGVFVAADVVTLYLCFTVMSFVGYALVIHDRSSSARRAGRIYLFLAVAGEVAVLAGVMLVVHAGAMSISEAPAAVADSGHPGLIVALLWAGFGVKAGTVPLHVWLPLAHPAAPTPASAVLSGVMITGGLMGWLRLLPLGESQMSLWGSIFLIGGLAGAFVAVPLGVLQAEAKTVLAYSSISQMGLLSALVGVALIEPDLAPAVMVAAVLYAVHHGLIKGSLFIGVSLWQAHGAGPLRWLVVAAMALAGLSLAGAPLTSGYLAKYVAKEAVGDLTVLGMGVAGLLTLVGAGSTVLLARTGWLLRPQVKQVEPVDLTLPVWLVVIAGSVPLVHRQAQHWSETVSPPGWLEWSTWWAQGWPILLGAVLAYLGIRISRTERLPAWLGHPDGRAVPAGDLVVLEEWIATQVRRASQVAGKTLATVRAVVTDRAKRVPSPARAILSAESALSQWPHAGVAFLGVLVVLGGVIWGSGI